MCSLRSRVSAGVVPGVDDVGELVARQVKPVAAALVTRDDSMLHRQEDVEHPPVGAPLAARPVCWLAPLSVIGACKTGHVTPRPILVNLYEQAADRQLRAVCDQRDARVLAKVRVADAVDVDALRL